MSGSEPEVALAAVSREPADSDERPLAVRLGSTVLVPFAAGSWRLEGSCAALRCRPPAGP